MEKSMQEQASALRARLNSPNPEEYWDGVHTGAGDSDLEETEASE